MSLHWLMMSRARELAAATCCWWWWWC